MNYRQGVKTTNELAGWYDNKYVEMGSCWHTPPEDSNRHLDDMGCKGGMLLDIGCGGGHFLLEAAKRCATVTGYEISEIARLEALNRLWSSALTNWAVLPDSIECPVMRGPFDWIVSIGSIEHVIDLNKALDNVREMLKPTGVFYMYVPTPEWIHQDQCNERTASPEEWRALFAEHGLIAEHEKRWGIDNVALWGHK